MSQPLSNRDPRWISLIVLCVGMLMIVLDGTVVNVALPSIQSDLRFSQSSLAWVVNAYLIAFGGLLLLAGRLGDLIGSKRIFIGGLVVFTLASLFCGIAWNQPVLVIARFIQGVGGAMASSVILSMIVTMFTEPQERTRAMGVFSFTASAGGSVGLLVGGTITQLVGWHWVFLLNVPIGIAAYFAAARFLESRPGIGLREGADGWGALLVTLSLMLGVYTVVEIPQQGLTSWHTLTLGAAAVVLLAGFLIREARIERPLLSLHIFRSRNITGSNILQVLIVAGMYGFFFSDALYLRRVLGYDAAATGLAFLPVTLCIGALSLGWAAWLPARFGAHRVVIAGTAAGAAGLAILWLQPVQANYFTTMLPAMLLMGIGIGASFPSLMMFAMADATPEYSGLVSGLVNTTAQVGGAFGLAILATLSTATTHRAMAAGQGNAAALSLGYHAAFGCAAIFMILATIVAATVLQPAAFEKHAETAASSTAA